MKTSHFLLLISYFLLLIFLPRLTHLGGYVIVDEADRWRWAEDFTNALLQRDLAATRVGDGYPGIVPVWAETAWIFAEATRRSWHAGQWIGEPGMYQLMHQWERQDSLHWQRLPIVVLNSLLTLAMIALIWRLWGGRVGLIAGTLIALDPFYLSDSRVNRAEAVITGLMMLSILWLMVYGYTKNRRDLILSAILGGLSLLTKIQALVMLPAVGLILWLILSQRETVTHPRQLFHPALIAKSLQIFSLWLLIAALTWFILWPAMWVTPLDTLTFVYNYATRKVGTEGVNLFFWGQTYQNSDPGLLFYPFVMLMRLSPIALIGLLGFMGRMSSKTSHLNQGGQRGVANLYLIVYLVVYAFAMSIGSHKQDRYILPIFPALDILGAVGLLYLGEKLRTYVIKLRSCHSEQSEESLQHSSRNQVIGAENRLGWAKFEGFFTPLRYIQNDMQSPNMRSGFAAFFLLLIIQIMTIYPHHPYYYSYFNPLLGGGATAVKTLRVGWGEGMDQVGQYLATKANGGDLVVSSRFTQNMPAFKGKAISLLPDGRWTQADYIVLYIQQVQRYQEPSPEFLAYFLARQPEKIITIGGIDYAKIYPMPFSITANPQISRINKQLALLGYRWEADGLPLRLWWENLGLTADRTLMARLVGAAGTTEWTPCAPDPDFRQPAQQSGAYVESLCDIELTTLPPDTYTVEIGLSHATQHIETIPFPNGWQAATLDEQHTMSDTSLLDRLEAIIAQKLPPKATRQQRVYNTQLHLVGYELNPPQPRPGETVELAFYWQLVGEMLKPVTLTVQLADSRLQPLGRDDVTLQVNSWLQNAIMPTHHTFTLSKELDSPLAAQVEITLYNEAQVALKATDFHRQALDKILTRFTISPPSTPESTFKSTSAIWQDGIELRGYQLPAQSLRGRGVLPIKLFWQTRQPLTQNLMVFIHLLDSHGQIISQNDSLPRNGAYPTPWWQPQLLIEDSHTLTLLADVPPGPYHLAVGLYDAESLTRLPLTDGADHVELGIRN